MGCKLTVTADSRRNPAAPQPRQERCQKVSEAPQYGGKCFPEHPLRSHKCATAVL